MNSRARRKEKSLNPKGKVTREELDALCTRLSKDFLVVYWVFDLIIEKGVFTSEELAAFIAKKVAEANNLEVVPPCNFDASTPSSSTPTLISAS